MKAEVNIDMQELVASISEVLLKELKPLLEHKSEDDCLFTVKTLAEYLHVSDQWVYERVHYNEIPFIKMGKFPRFKKSDIDQWLDSLATPPLNRLSHTHKMRLLKASEKR